jgi:hypothetical protein
MSAPQDLLAYFQTSGALSAEQIRYLSEKGFLPPPAEDYHDYHDDWPPDLGDESDDAWELEQTRKPRRGGGRPKGRRLRARGLNARLGGVLAAGAARLTTLARIAALLGSADAEPAVTVGHADLGALEDALARGLGDQSLPLRELWDLLAFEEYRALLAEPGLRGPAVTAYRGLLAGVDRAPGGAFTWVLRQPHVRRVYQLARAQRHLLRACGRLQRGQPLVLEAALRRDPHPVAYWALILLYNSGRLALGVEETTAPAQPWTGKHEVLRASPPVDGEGGAVWRQAWAHALLMDPRRVLPFLAIFYGPRNDSGVPRAESPLELWCPDGWSRLAHEC